MKTTRSEMKSTLDCINSSLDNAEISKLEHRVIKTIQNDREKKDKKKEREKH